MKQNSDSYPHPEQNNTMEMRLKQAMKALAQENPEVAKQIRYWSQDHKQMFFAKAGLLEYHACFDRLLANKLAYMEVKTLRKRLQ